MPYLIWVGKCLPKRMAAESLPMILLVKQNRIGETITRALNSTTARKSNWHETSLLEGKKKESNNIRWCGLSKTLQSLDLRFKVIHLDCLSRNFCSCSRSRGKWVWHLILTYQKSSFCKGRCETRSYILKWWIKYHVSVNYDVWSCPAKVKMKLFSSLSTKNCAIRGRGNRFRVRKSRQNSRRSVERRTNLYMRLATIFRSLESCPAVLYLYLNRFS